MACVPDQKLCLPVGTSPTWAFTVTDPETADAAVDISGASFSFYVKESPSDADADAIYSLTSADSEIVITGATDGEAEIYNPAAKTALLELGRFYSWSLRITFSGGETRTVRIGSLEATRP